MKRLIPAVEHRKVARARRHRRLAYLQQRRPDDLRTGILAAQVAVADAWDGIAIALQSAVAAMAAFELDDEETPA